jgi:hypothetical protein
MAVELRCGRTAALGTDPRGRELKANAMGFRLGTPHLTGGSGLFHVHVLDGSPADVIVPAKERPCSKQATQGSIIEGGKRFREGTGQGFFPTQIRVAFLHG